MFDLTREERRVILFLITAALAGTGVNFFAKKYAHTKAVVNFYHDIGKVNLATADKNLLIGIPGIGEKLAGRILEYRQQQAGFSAVEELKNIKGISVDKYEKIKNFFILR